jgi:outer membrane receptor protein involved in Fe transport
VANGRIQDRLLASFWLLFAASLPDLANSAAEEATGDENRPLESVIVTATRIELSVLDVAEAVSVIDSEEITRRAPELLAEMFRGMPGAFYQQTTPGQGVPIIRGLKGSQVLHLVDGIRLNNAFFRDAPNQYLGLVDAYATERVEVIRGSAPSLFGADAMGGVVQVLSREPDFDSPDWSASGTLYGAYNSADSSLIGRAEAAVGRSGSVFSGGITYQDHGDRRVGGGETVGPSGYRVEAADLKWRQDVGARGELMVAAQYLEQPSTPRVDELVPGYGQDTPSSEQYFFRPNRRDFLHARYRLESESRWFRRFEAHLARQTIDDDRLTKDYGSTAFLREYNTSDLDALTLQFNTPWQGFGAKAELVWGIELYRDTVSSSRYRGETASDPGIPVPSRFPDGSTMDSSALYASNQWRWDRFSIDAGLRYSVFEILLPASPDAPMVKLEPTDLTGDIHLGYEVAPGVHVVANLGRGFRPPNVFDLGTLGSRPGNRFNVPNPDLKPETVWSYDVGIKLSTGRWQLEGFAWYADYRDKISSRLTGDVTPEGRLIVRSDNLNEARLYGVETGVRYLFCEDLELYTVLNYTRGEEHAPGEISVPADRIPPLNGRVGFAWNAGERWLIEPYIDFAGSQDRLSPRDEEDPRIDPEGTSAWATVNLLISWQVRDRLGLGLKLMNLGDRNYREHGSGIDAPGRNLGVWINVSF